VSEGAYLVVGAAIGAIGTFAATWLTLRWKWGAAQTTRRREIRAALLEFDAAVRGIAWGGWPGGTHEAWAPELGKVLNLRRVVIIAIDLDRRTPGKRWCRKVKYCTDAGWALVHHCQGQSIGVIRGDADLVTQTFKTLREGYVRKYEDVQ